MMRIEMAVDVLRRRMDCMDSELISVQALAEKSVKVLGLRCDALGVRVVLEGHSEHLEFLVSNTGGLEHD